MAIVTKTLEQEYIETAEDLVPGARTRNLLEAKLVIAEELVPTTGRRRHTEDSADRVILQAAIDGAAPLPATQTIVSNGQALTVPVTGSYTTTATVSVAGGVVTGIVLS